MTIKNSAYVYLGPEKPFGLPLARNTVLATDPEKVFPALEPLFKEHKNFQRLFVPVADLGQARFALKQGGSALRMFYNDIKAASDSQKAARGN